MYADMSKEGMLHRRPRTVVKIMSSMCVCVFQFSFFHTMMMDGWMDGWMVCVLSVTYRAYGGHHKIRRSN